MAHQERCRWSFAVAFWIFLHLGLCVVPVLGEGANAGCPSYPSDPSWKDSLGGDQSSAVPVRIMRSLRVLAGTFQQGARPLLTKPTTSSEREEVQGVRLVVIHASPSDSRDVYSVSVTLTLGFWQKYSPVGLRGGGRGRLPGSTQDVNINGEGTFNEKTGELCVIGCIGSLCKYKLSLRYPAPKTIHHVSTVGKLSSIAEATDPTFFDPVTLHSITDGPFQYTMNATLAKECPTMEPDVLAEKLWREEKVCSQGWASSHQVWSTQAFDVVWNPECEGANCSPFVKVGKAGEGKGASLRFDRIRCDGNRIQGILVVTNSLQAIDRFADPTATDGTLIAEGTWDSTTGKMCMIACHLFGKEDCEIAVTMQFPLTFKITQRSLVVGHIRSLRKVKDASYFKPITFRQLSTGLQVTRFTSVKNQPEYVYTKVEEATTLCALEKKKSSSSGISYPNGVDWRDLEFHGVKDGSKAREGLNSFVNLNLFTLGDQFRTYGQLHVTSANVTGIGKQGIMNVSYSMHYAVGLVPGLDANMAGEGIYNPKTGKLCLVGCRTVDIKKKELKQELTQLEGDGRKDCQVFLSVQLPGVNSQDVLKGTVKSLRVPADLLYFKPESFSGSIFMQVAAVVWRVDLEIVISVVMLSLTVVLILVQLVYSKRYPETLPYISTSMLLLLSLAHMIPLVLNFEALFQKKKNDYRVIERGAGWPEVNEVVVRLTTMAAMLLQLRLLQLVWKSRIKSRASGDLGAAAVQERRVLYTILPLYILGGVAAVLFHSLLGFRPYEREFLWSSNQGGLWWDIKAYGGLLLDFHLFPQVVGNILWGAKEQAPLSKPFYFGMALVRSLPHIYDLCRKFRFIPAFTDTYIYANPEWDFYSVTSDILIPLVILLQAVMVYMQQRWGGRCLLPRRWRSTFEYEKVDVIAS